MSGLQVVLGNVNGNESGGFNPGTRRIITTKKDRQRSSGGGGGDRGGRGRGDDDESHRDQPRRDRPRISIKDKREVSVSLHALGGAEGAAAAGISAEHVGSGLLEGTSLRRKVVDVRQRNSREAKLQSRREQEAQEKDVSSGFNTQGGQRRALIVLPKSAEKMAAREMLMQMHPHIAQVFRGLNPPDTFTQEPFSRILGENAPLMPYRRRQMEVKTVVQWAERRLFLWELEFLTSFALRPGTIVVYADCAPGTRIPYLASLFPHVSFVCVDPTSLDIDESAVPNVAVKQEAFSDALARQMRQEAEATGKTVLFISSATADSPVGGLLAEEYSKDTGFSEAALDAQKRFYLLLKPAKALLKFSLPWTDGSTHYLDGDVMLGVWNGPTSTEARIVPNGFQRTWSHRHFEEQMMHFNNVSGQSRAMPGRRSGDQRHRRTLTHCLFVSCVVSLCLGESRVLTRARCDCRGSRRLLRLHRRGVHPRALSGALPRHDKRRTRIAARCATSCAAACKAAQTRHNQIQRPEVDCIASTPRGQTAAIRVRATAGIRRTAAVSRGAGGRTAAGGTGDGAGGDGGASCCIILIRRRGCNSC